MIQEVPPDRFKSLKRFLPFLIFAVALGVRLIGINWGLPNELHNQSYHPDEPIIWAASQSLEPAKLKFTPGFYNYGTLYLTILRVGSDIAATYSGKGEPKNFDEYWKLMAQGHKVGRVISALAGAGTVLVVFLMIRRRIGTIGASAAALAFAFAPGHVVHSQFQTVDAVATLFFAFGTWFAVRIIEEEGSALKLALLSGLFFGMSASVKYTGLVGIVATLLALFLAARSQFVKAGMMSVGVAVAALVVGTPGILLDFAKFKDALVYEMGHTASGHGLIFEGVPGGFFYHLGNLLVGWTPLVFFLALVGLLLAAVRKDKAMWVIGIAAFAMYLVVGRAQVSFLRYTLPLYPAIACGFGWLVAQSHRAGGIQKGIVGLAILAVGAEVVSGTIRFVGWMSGEDPRDSAAKYIKSVSDDSTTVGVVSDPWYYTPPFYPDTSMPRSVPDAPMLEARLAATKPKVLRALPPGQARGASWGNDLFDLRPDYIVFSSFEAEDLVRLSKSRATMAPDIQAQVDAFKGFDTRLRKEYALVAPAETEPYKTTVPPMVHDMEYVHPTIWIWKRRPN